MISGPSGSRREANDKAPEIRWNHRKTPRSSLRALLSPSLSPAFATALHIHIRPCAQQSRPQVQTFRDFTPAQYMGIRSEDHTCCSAHWQRGLYHNSRVGLFGLSLGLHHRLRASIWVFTTRADVIGGACWWVYVMIDFRAAAVRLVQEPS